MRWLKRLLPVLLVVAIGLGGWEYFRRSLRVSLGYSVEASFTTAPEDDRALSEWLQSQPGVVPHTVHVQRVGFNNNQLLRLVFIQSRSLAGDPAFPDLDAACGDLGYAGPGFAFRDTPDRFGRGSGPK